MENERLTNKDFRNKAKATQETIIKTVELLEKFGLPIEDFSSRRLERAALAFLAVADVKKGEDFVKAKGLDDGRSLKTRDIIKYLNENFEENISSGSYDDIRRKDLRMMILGSIVVRTSPNSARNDSTRGYALNPSFADLTRTYGETGWTSKLAGVLQQVGSVKEKLTREREIELVPVTLPTGENLKFSPGGHNVLQKNIIEDFLPRFGYGAEVLYVGDTSDKYLFLNKERIEDLNFFDISHGELPDVVAYSEDKNWLYLIEAVYSSGPVSSMRMAELKDLTKDCTADIVYVTAFLNKVTFRKFMADVAWESEVWIADAPDHLIHFNGDKFMGPHN
jgi:hypothetical protein